MFNVWEIGAVHVGTSGSRLVRAGTTIAEQRRALAEIAFKIEGDGP